MNTFVPYGYSLEKLVEEVGYDGLGNSVFDCECKCGNVISLEPDGSTICPECKEKVESPLITHMLI